MHLKNLRLQNFRNHLESAFEFSRGINILIGGNGQGKSNVIEAISYLCITKSFLSKSDNAVLNFGKNLFEVEGEIVSNNNQPFNIRVAYSDNQKEKIYTINKHRIEPFSSVIGKFPVVICSPEHASVTVEGPAARRKFVDFVISQSHNVYFKNLIEYRHILKQRNKILLTTNKSTGSDISSLIEPWNKQMAELGSYLMLTRKQFVIDFQKYITEIYKRLTDDDGEPEIQYYPTFKINGNYTCSDIEQIFSNELKNKIADEIRFKTSLIGPQRDEFIFRTNQKDIRKYASQGQHKTFLIALKIGEFHYLRDICHETPILLLDDIFSELDEQRSIKLLEFVDTLSQTFITTTNPSLFNKNKNTGESIKIFLIQDGKVNDRTMAAA